ncbi:hypothetical protein Tco_0016767 [Tanacetum coccineum]
MPVNKDDSLPHRSRNEYIRAHDERGYRCSDRKGSLIHIIQKKFYQSKKAVEGLKHSSKSQDTMTNKLPDVQRLLLKCEAYAIVARYQARPTQKYLKEVKGIFKYLKSTINIGLGYPKDSGFKLTAFSDADHAGCIDTCKSTFLEDTFPCFSITKSIHTTYSWLILTKTIILESLKDLKTKTLANSDLKLSDNAKDEMWTKTQDRKMA